MSINITKQHSCCLPETNPTDHKYRLVLWIVLILNFTMFGIEFVYGLHANSASLLSDSLDFLGDGINYTITLLVISHSLYIRAKASIVKAIMMLAFAFFVFSRMVMQMIMQSIPQVDTMGILGIFAFVINMVALFLLYHYRHGDSNKQAAWLCSRNDALGNLAVLLAAVGVFFTKTNWPDLIVALIMIILAVKTSWYILKLAYHELQHKHSI
ncbi:MAG: cation transporter [Alphaproteobacteria bacterium]|nr:cation transporter [Alphaproteobacteria bacterium]